MKKNYPICLLLLWLTTACFAQTKASLFDVARNGTATEAEAIVKANPTAVNISSPEGFTPLILSAYHLNNSVARFLVDHGADVNAKSNMGTALMAAVVKKNTEITKYLLEHNANPNLADSNGGTALLYAAMFRNYEIAKLLMQYKADASAKDGNGKSAIDYAIVADDDQMIQLLKSK